MFKIKVISFQFLNKPYILAWTNLHSLNESITVNGPCVILQHTFLLTALNIFNCKFSLICAKDVAACIANARLSSVGRGQILGSCLLKWLGHAFLFSRAVRQACRELALCAWPHKMHNFITNLVGKWWRWRES